MTKEQLFLQLKDGFFCKWCKDIKNTSLKLNSNEQLYYKCEKCKRDWL